MAASMSPDAHVALHGIASLGFKTWGLCPAAWRPTPGDWKDAVCAGGTLIVLQARTQSDPSRLHLRTLSPVSTVFAVAGGAASGPRRTHRPHTGHITLRIAPSCLGARRPTVWTFGKGSRVSGQPVLCPSHPGPTTRGLTRTLNHCPGFQPPSISLQPLALFPQLPTGPQNGRHEALNGLCITL